MSNEPDSVYSYDDKINKTLLHLNDQATLKSLLERYHNDAPPGLDPRRTYSVTASDIAAICGENPYETADGVLRKKMFHVVTPDNENTIHGRKYEPIAIGQVKGKVIDGSKVKQVYYIKYVAHPKYTWLGGTLDGIIELEDGRVFVMEVKCPLKRRIIDGLIPSYYMSQVQTYMFITGLNACVFVQYKPKMGPRSKEKLDLTLIKADEWYIPIRLRILKQFRDRMVIWRYVQEQMGIMAVNALKNRWLGKRCLSGKRPLPDHKCTVHNERLRNGIHHTNMVLMLSMCRDRLAIVKRSGKPKSIVDHDQCVSQKKVVDMTYDIMYKELLLCSQPLKLCECMMGSIICFVSYDPMVTQPRYASLRSSSSSFGKSDGNRWETKSVGSLEGVDDDELDEVVNQMAEIPHARRSGSYALGGNEDERRDEKMDDDGEKKEEEEQQHTWKRKTLGNKGATTKRRSNVNNAPTYVSSSNATKDNAACIVMYV